MLFPLSQMMMHRTEQRSEALFLWKQILDFKGDEFIILDTMPFKSFKYETKRKGHLKPRFAVETSLIIKNKAVTKNSFIWKNVFLSA